MSELLAQRGKVPALDELSRILQQEEFAAHAVWAEIFFTRVLESVAPTVSESVEEFVRIYVGKATLEDLRNHIVGFAQQMNEPQKVRRAIRMLVLFFRAKDVTQEFFRRDCSVPEQVWANWPSELRQFKELFASS
jgi:hypothetical protein